MEAEISRAVAAHGMWKARLRNAIDSGSFDGNVETVKNCHLCEFGKWLDSVEQSKRDAHYRDVARLHEKFHGVAAKVAKLVVDKKKDEANSLLSMSGEFTVVSSELTRAMMNWKKAL
ncbi:MAG: CZB domain-containing protein [Candidatus Kapaibacterium sp.]